MDSVTRFLALSDGYGSGSGSGYGDGDGYGSGDGYGYGYGYGSGDGSGDGYGDGSGYGSGYGDGYGYGSGDGYGDGIQRFGRLDVHGIDGMQTVVTSVKGNIAKGFILNVDLTTTPCFVAKVGDCFAHGKTAHEAVADANRKHLETMPVEEKASMLIAAFEKGPLTGLELFDWHGALTGSCQMGREAFVRDRGIDLGRTYTLSEFIEITKGAYGSEAIETLRVQSGL